MPCYFREELRKHVSSSHKVWTGNLHFSKEILKDNYVLRCEYCFKVFNYPSKLKTHE